MPRIATASAQFPCPLESAGKAPHFSTLKSLMDDHKFTLVCLVFDEA